MTSLISKENLRELTEENIPIVLPDRNLKNEEISNVLIDNQKGAYLATEHLIKLNHKKIAFISGPEDSYDNSLRFRGYKKALKDHEIIFDKNLVIQGDFTEKSGYNSVSEFLTNTQNYPTAFFLLTMKWQ